ncbi:MAG: hypothetical protein ACM3VT_00330 [Solirubrobacterales bacterium]
MKASTQNAAGILIYLLSVGALGWSIPSMYGIDLMFEPFGSMMVLSRTILSLATLGMMYGILRRQTTPAGQAIRVRAHARHG